MNAPRYYCCTCGGVNVVHAHWVNPNTEEVHGVFGSWNEEDATFCHECDGPTEIRDAVEVFGNEVENVYEGGRYPAAPGTQEVPS